jgi:ABC-type glutathione transport system ATPase component
MADNIGIMKDGRLIEFGSTDKVLDSPENEYTKKLIRDVPRLKR